MQVGCGVYVHTIRARAYLYFWHYESKGRSRVQVKEYIGPRKLLDRSQRRSGVAMPITSGRRRSCNVCEPRPRPRFADLC